MPFAGRTEAHECQQKSLACAKRRILPQLSRPMSCSSSKRYNAAKPFTHGLRLSAARARLARHARTVKRKTAAREVMCRDDVNSICIIVRYHRSCAHAKQVKCSQYRNRDKLVSPCRAEANVDLCCAATIAQTPSRKATGAASVVFAAINRESFLDHAIHC